MRSTLWKRSIALTLALILCLSILPASVFGANPVLTVTPAPGFTVYEFTGETADAKSGTPLTGTLDLSQTFYFMTGNDVQMSGMCLWPVEGDELPPATICNSAYNGKVYSDDLLVLKQVSSSSLMAGTILGKTVGYDWDTGKFYANEGLPLQYMAAGDYYPEPGRYRFLMFYSSYCYYSDVFTITDNANLTANQGVLDATWFADGAATKTVPYDTEANVAKFDISLSLPAEVTGLNSIRLLRADYDIFGSDSYYYFAYTQDPTGSFKIGQIVDEGVNGEYHTYYLKDCSIENMALGCYRTKVLDSFNKPFIDNSVIVVKEASSSSPTITTESLPSGKAEESYYAKLEATPAEDGAITWSVASGKLPDGVTLNAATGELTGTPTAEGSFPFFVRASESGAGYAEKEFSITIAEADLAVRGETSFWCNTVEEQIKRGSSYSLWMPLNRVPHTDETGAAILYYTTLGGEGKTISQTLTSLGWESMSANGTLPEDAGRVDRVEFFLNGAPVGTQAVGKTVAPALELEITGHSEQYLYLYIYNDAGDCVKSYSVGHDGKTLQIDCLPSGTYEASLSGQLYGYGYFNYGRTTVTLNDGALQHATLPISPHYTTRVEINPAAEGKDGASNACIEWYADEAGTQKLQNGSWRTLLDDEAAWVRVIPQYSMSVTHLPTELIRVDRGGVTTGFRTVTVTMPKKPTATVHLNVLLTQLDGSAPAPGWYSVSTTKYGTNGWINTNYYERNAEPIQLAELQEGTKITVSGSTGWGSVSYTVTAADVAAGSLELPLTLPLADGLIYWSVTQTDAAGTRPFWNLGYLDNVRIYKTDGAELGFVRRNEFLLLTDPDAVTVGETLRLVGWRGDKVFPYDYGEAQFTVMSDGGRKTGSVVLPMVSRSRVSFSLYRGAEAPEITLLVYGADGGLLHENREKNNKYNYAYSQIALTTPYLPAGSYFVGAAPAAYLDGLEPEAYDTAAELALLPYAVVQPAGPLVFEPIHLGTLELPEGFRAYQQINLAVSGVSMNKASGETFRLDVTAATKPGFTWESNVGGHQNVELYILTNQAGTNDWGGHVSTRTLSLNGIPLEIDRWNQNGTLRDDGSITLTLSPEKIEAYGGFPLRFSTTCYMQDAETLEAKAYLRYWQGGSFHSDFVGEFEEATGALTLTAPNMITDGSFTVYGRGPASLKGDPYTLTLFMNGQPVASGVTDTNRGYYRIRVDLDENQLYPMQTLRFSVSGSYQDGMRTYTSEETSTLYNPEGAQLQTMVLHWESHQGDFAAGRGQSIVMLNDGDAPNLYTYWYRGGTSADMGRVFWSVTFDGHPEKVQGARIYIPRNGTTETLECTKQPDGSWATEPTYFFGAAPDSSWVEFDCPVEYGYVSDPDGAVTQGDVTAFLSLLAGGGSVSDTDGSPLGDGMLTFLLGDPEKGQLPVGFSIWNESWNEAEFAELQKLELDPHTPNLLRYEEGWMTFGEGEDAFTVWGTDSVTRYVNHDDHAKHAYVEEIYTPDFRLITTWDEATRTKQVSLLMIGALNFTDMELGGFDDETLHEIARTGAVQDTWLTFYEKFADALIEAVNALDPAYEPSGKMQITDVAWTAAPAMRGPSTQEIANVIEKIQKRKEQIEKVLDNHFTKIVQDSYNWAHGEEITQQQIRRVKDFLDDNPCLKRLYRFWRSATNDANNPYRVISEADAMYYKVGVEGIAKILEEAINSSSYLEGSAKEGAKKMGEALYKGSVERAYDGWKQLLYDADIFERQIENLCQELYIAARRAENEERGIGGLCKEGIDWRRFPREYYDYNKYFGYGPRAYSHVTPPPGPQGRYDPSGYVYEAVPSNRVEGAEVTLFQLEGDYAQTADDSGVALTLSGGSPVIVDAELFGLEPNPQITGSDGRYQWFVPSGWWRVQAAKSGYETVDTGTSGDYGVDALKNEADGYYYMPVLPEQLDVNLPLVSYEAPAVLSVSANTLGVFVTFTKYMDETTLTPDRFVLFVNGEKTDFTVELSDSEKSGAAEAAPSYTRTVKLNYPAIAEGDALRLIVENSVLSYAGVAMEERYDADGLTVALPEQAKTPAAEPASGEVEKDTAIRFASATERAVLRYTLDGSTPTETSPVLTDAIIITEETTVKVIATRPDMLPSAVLTAHYTIPAEKTAPDRVVATVNGARVSDGDTVKPGKLVLTCSTEGAEIWYTTNGVCPCDDETARHLYTAPIDLTPGTYFFRIRALKDGVYSPGLPLHLTVEDDDAHAHDWGAPTYVWAEDYSTVIATRVCKTDASHVETETVNTTSKVTKEATVEAEGEITYTAVFENAAFTTQTKTVATPKLVRPVQNNPFKDVQESDYFYDAVLWAYYHDPQVTNGLDATHFGPNATCTRGQIVTFLWRALGEPESTITNNPFVDVKESDYYYKAVLWAYENGVTTGTDATHFAPDAFCKREHAVAFLYRAAGNPEYTNKTNPFSDVSSSAYYYDAVLWAVEKNITKGMDATHFGPSSACQRSQIVTFLYRFMNP